MAICKLTILTIVDGQESKLVQMGKVECKEEHILLSYRDENAQVAIMLQNGQATVERKGDYSLTLPLIQGKDTEGCLGMGGSEGKIPVRSYHVGYEQIEDCLHIRLHYHLLFGADAQDMRLTIKAQMKSGR